MVQLLLNYGADPQITNDGGKAAIDIALARGHTDVAAWLASGP